MTEVAAPSASAVLAGAVRQLDAAGVPDAGRDARRLMAHALEVPPARLSLALPEPMTVEAQARFATLIARRAERVPLSHITGEREFWGRAFRVTGDVLDPRPETETLIAAALEAPFASVLDLGTGSGCILLTLLAERPGTIGTGTDLSPGALAVAAENRARLGLDPSAALLPGSWTDPLSADARFDLIVSNPPYIAAGEMDGLSLEVLRHEPRMALTDEGDGLAAYQAIAARAPAHLAPGGRLMVEIGPTQGPSVAALFASAGLRDVTVRPDMDGRDRVVSAKSAQNPAS